jgi:hypothetical protein
MTPKLVAAAAALLLAGALPPAVARSSSERAAPVSAEVVAQGGARVQRALRRCRQLERRSARRACRRAARRRTASRARDRLVDLGPGPLPPPLDPGDPPPPPEPPEPALPRYVSATTTEWDIVLSRQLVAAGTVRIELRNTGEDPHDLVVMPEAGGEAVHHFAEHDPDTWSDAPIELPAGRYRLFCSLLDHAERGMQATLRVD